MINGSSILLCRMPRQGPIVNNRSQRPPVGASTRESSTWGISNECVLQNVSAFHCLHPHANTCKMGATTDFTMRWAARLVQTGAPPELVGAWRVLRGAIGTHQKLLREEGIGISVNERDRVRVNARRVGLEAPAFADEVMFDRSRGGQTSTDISRGTRQAAAAPGVKQWKHFLLHFAYAKTTSAMFSIPEKG